MTGLLGASQGVAVRRFLPAVGVLLCVLAACGPSSAPGPISLSGTFHGESWTVTIVDPSGDLDADTVRKAVDEVLARVAAQIWDENSEITRFNQAGPGAWVPVSAELAELVRGALTIGRETAGAFDITRLPLLELWGVAGKRTPEVPPGADRIRRARERTGIGFIEVRDQPPALRKAAPKLTLYLVEVAPGYAIGQIADRLDELGATRYRIEFGDTLYVRGRDAEQQPWTVAIEGLQTHLELSNASMASAGGGLRSIVLGGRRFSATIDPRTGRPVAHGLDRVTVVAADPARAGALARALLVMGEQAGQSYANAHDIAALFVSRETGGNRLTHSRALDAYLDSQAAVKEVSTQASGA